MSPHGDRFNDLPFGEQELATLRQYLTESQEPGIIRRPGAPRILTPKTEFQDSETLRGIGRPCLSSSHDWDGPYQVPQRAEDNPSFYDVRPLRAYMESSMDGLMDWIYINDTLTYGGDIPGVWHWPQRHCDEAQPH